MDVLQIIHQIGGDHHAGVPHGQCRRLRLPDLRQGLRIRRTRCVPIREIAVGGQLHVIKREITLPPCLSPTGDQRLHLVRINRPIRDVDGVGFPLIPDRPAQGVRDEGRDHSIVKSCGGLGCDSPLRRHRINLRRKPLHSVESHRGSPRLNPCAAHSGNNQSHRHSKFTMQFPPEKVGGGGEPQFLV